MKNDNCDYYIILACKKQGDDQVGFFHFPALFQGIYRKNTEKWVYLVASTDELPNEELLNKAKCLIIPGSDLSVYNESKNMVTILILILKNMVLFIWEIRKIAKQNC